MPLPANGLTWPPVQLTALRPAFDQWSAWYAGDAAALASVYATQAVGPANRPSQFRGGVVGAVARTFWGAPRVDLTKPGPVKLHVPIAADICQASADLLFADPPTVTVDDDTTQERLTDLVGDGMLTTLAEGAEVAAGLGGVYLRVTWDQTVEDGPFLSVVHADAAWPEFRWGRLTAVTFWHVIATQGQTVWRHLERHETTSGGNGVILHGLYEGTVDNLGRAVPLTDQPATEGLAGLVDAESAIDTGSPGLAVVYVPNQRPQRKWRRDPLGVNLGRSDLDGIEPLMDALDETYSSWMRDIRLGKARVFVAQGLLTDLGPGLGAAWDADAELYSPLNALGGGRDTPLGNQLDAQQFKIRYAEHQATAQQLVEDILRSAGYSAQTFGESDGSTGAATATEIQARQQRSFLTRDRKIRLWRPALAQLVEKLLAVDRFVFGSQVVPSRPDVTFSDGVQDSPLTLAQTAQALNAAGAASTETLVRLVHPDWDDEQVGAEVGRIHSETGAAVPDPFPGETQAGRIDQTVGSTGADQPDAG